MSRRELVLPVLLISIVLLSTTSSSITQPQALLIVRLSPAPMRSLESVPDRWKTVHPEYIAPQVEIQLLKGHVSPNENWMFTNEYKYSSKDYDAAAKMTSEEKKIPRTDSDDMEERENMKENDVQDNNGMPDKFIPQIGSRNIITAPVYCPKGQRKDSRERCRTIIM